MEEKSKPSGLAGLRILSLESRRAEEMAKLILAYGGQPVVAPSMREVPLESNVDALDFARQLFDGGFDMVIFLTGVGTRALARVIATSYPVEQFVEALKKVVIVARGPKPIAALKELGVPVILAVPEPNTWRDVLRSLDEKAASLPLDRKRVAVQEYGSSNPELLRGLAERGAVVTPVPVYQWALPEDTAPLRNAIAALTRGEIDIILFTTSHQVPNLLQVAAEMKLQSDLRRSFSRILVGSIGPVTSEELRAQGIAPDFEPSHPKMGFLINELAQRAPELLQHKRAQAIA